jgi:hypothetical protein
MLGDWKRRKEARCDDTTIINHHDALLIGKRKRELDAAVIPDPGCYCGEDGVQGIQHNHFRFGGLLTTFHYHARNYKWYKKDALTGSH